MHSQPLRRRLVVGNWKMNGSRAQLKELADLGEIVRLARETNDIEVGLALPATLIAEAALPCISIGAQDVHAADEGAFTGDISASMLAEAGAQWAIVGHSERRSGHAERDEEVLAKLKALSRAKMGAILCVGESGGIREAGQAEGYVAAQVRRSLPRQFDPHQLAIAYEPVWAIGSERSASLGDITAMRQVIRCALTRQLGRAGEAVRILYGGSVDHRNIGPIMMATGVDGVLAGRASLHRTGFRQMIEAATDACRNP